MSQVPQSPIIQAFFRGLSMMPKNSSQDLSTIEESCRRELEQHPNLQPLNVEKTRTLMRQLLELNKPFVFPESLASVEKALQFFLSDEDKLRTVMSQKELPADYKSHLDLIVSAQGRSTDRAGLAPLWLLILSGIVAIAAFLGVVLVLVLIMGLVYSAFGGSSSSSGGSNWFLGFVALSAGGAAAGGAFNQTKEYIANQFLMKSAIRDNLPAVISSEALTAITSALRVIASPVSPTASAVELSSLAEYSAKAVQHSVEATYLAKPEQVSALFTTLVELSVLPSETVAA